MSSAQVGGTFRQQPIEGKLIERRVRRRFASLAFSILPIATFNASFLLDEVYLQMPIISREVIVGASLEYGRAVLLHQAITINTAVIP